MNVNIEQFTNLADQKNKILYLIIIVQYFYFFLQWQCANVIRLFFYL